jgi:hypothetical protein
VGCLCSGRLLRRSRQLKIILDQQSRPELPDHKPIRLKPFNYLGQHFYFVTICTFQRRAIFSDTKLSHWLLSLLRMESANNSFNVHAYCLMPDHLLAEGIEPTSAHFVKILKN